MNKKIVLGIGVLILLAVSGAYVIRRQQSDAALLIERTRTVKGGGLDASSNYPTQENNDSGISIFITPKDLSLKAAAWDFNVTMSNHMYDLGTYDLSKLAVLTDDKGNTYKPLAWTPDAKEGHHIGGLLRFARGESTSRDVVLKISGIGSSDERVFRWSI